jgi:AcrR family transcriptional regulator
MPEPPHRRRDTDDAADVIDWDAFAVPESHRATEAGATDAGATDAGATNAGDNGAQPDAVDRLLLAAHDAFARHGFDGASVRDITAAAGVNLGAITYHFGSKDHLYARVLLSLVGPLGARLRWAMQAPVPPLERVERAVRAFFEHIRARPEMPAIMVREMASGRAIAAPILGMMRMAIPLVAGVIAEGQKDGSIRAGDPLLLTLSTFAQPVYLNLARPALAAVAGLDLADDAHFQRVVDHAALTVRRALENR